ncbi:beta-defensin 134 [Lutra lutra]|uniref:beta-defensin 134 n=1 Tax=Lutra lutra TaxID=9657 RepID=UPI001FD1AE4F|nr:beta-defensin 134 [Lutra lutra]
MKLLFVMLALLFFWDPAMAGLNPLAAEIHKKCYRNGICRLECYTSEMLVANCGFQLECCVKGNPDP